MTSNCPDNSEIPTASMLKNDFLIQSASRPASDFNAVISLQVLHSHKNFNFQAFSIRKNGFSSTPDQLRDVVTTIY